MVATQFYAVADTMIIGLRLDADALAAVSNASTVLMIFLFISGGMELGGGLLVAAGKPTATKREMTELLYNLLFVDEVIALLTTAVGFVTLPALLRLINTPAEILDTAVLYGRIYLLGLPFLMPYDLSKECVMGCGDSKTPLKVIVATSAMNIVLDLVLVGPFGVAGAAASTLAVCLPSFAVIYVISLFFDRFLQLTVVANAFKGIQACVIYLILSAGIKMLKNLQRTPFNTAVVAVVLAAMVGCSMLAVKFSSICCILLCGAAGVLAYAVGQGKKGGTK